MPKFGDLVLVLALAACQTRATEAPSQPVPSAAPSPSPIASAPAESAVAVPDEQVEATDKAIAKLRPSYRRCIARGLETDPTMPSTIRLTISLEPNGAVTKVDVVATPPLPAQATECMAAVTKAVRFVPRGGDAGASIRVRISF